MRSTLAALSLLLLTGCAGASGEPSDGALADLWAAFGGAEPVFPECVERFATIYEFGVRDLACAAATSFPLSALAERAPAAPFRSGPHRVSAAGVELDLDAERQFGRYDPTFVRWATRAAVVRGEAARRLIGPVYEARVARSARTFWLAHRGLAGVGFPDALPAGPLSDYAAYLDGGPVTDAIRGFAFGASVSPYALRDEVAPILPPGETIVPGATSPLGEPLTADHWRVKAELSTALAFWIRREADGTRADWLSGLEGLLAAYDAGWLAAHGG